MRYLPAFRWDSFTPFAQIVDRQGDVLLDLLPGLLGLSSDRVVFDKDPAAMRKDRPAYTG